MMMQAVTVIRSVMLHFLSSATKEKEEEREEEREREREREREY